ncbi:MAG: hypothetical protein A3J58_01285 [Candidatus Sungbacteria bacterium RIFCSPHIGHO2_02_FULL_52_23]|uniref:Plasmid stabilization protein n=1 Tax=Candidatus Sungbacteria bacterium RIFCSPHIGHO2_02_FULL_52_23 TaxID=1802274 RepID=A0A1G2KVZ8_9BACT|nr:MAG: hypothetical protein A3J58_01285 [Candidatus Sungbacteria bacterium RIFCSPHIGHO2_02_FULL_52_23]
MNWVLTVNSSVRKTLKRISRTDAERIVKAFEELTINPYAGDIRKMEGEDDTWRRRIGAYRIKYEVQTAERIIRIFEISRRTSKTY